MAYSSSHAYNPHTLWRRTNSCGPLTATPVATIDPAGLDLRSRVDRGIAGFLGRKRTGRPCASHTCHRGHDAAWGFPCRGGGFTASRHGWLGAPLVPKPAYTPGITLGLAGGSAPSIPKQARARSGVHAKGLGHPILVSAPARDRTEPAPFSRTVSFWG